MFPCRYDKLIITKGDPSLCAFQARRNSRREMGESCQWVQDGDPVGCRVQKRLIFVAEKTMVYGRYNELVHGGYNGL